MRTGFAHPLSHPAIPINTLPVELLSHVFNLSTHAYAELKPDDHHQDSPFNPESVTIPTTLASVSRHWRNVALSTPSIWTSLCITVDDVAYSDGTDIIDMRRLVTHLVRARNLPLDILIDARDPDWDFSESEEYGYELYPNSCEHPFRSKFMTQILDVLFPHLHKWRSLAILTDTWAPMYAAVRRLGSTAAPIPLGAASPTPIGAPLLEKLTLMRCNEFISHAPEFTPRHLKDPVYAPFTALFGEDVDLQLPMNLLPRLRSLTLSGVHVNWSTLSHLLSGSSTAARDHKASYGLQTLELSYHCPDVRPSHDEFHRILRACPDMRKLVIKISGPRSNAEERENGDSEEPISLPLLEEIVLAYNDAGEATKVLSLIHAPSLKTLVIEDGMHPANPVEEDSGCLLAYCGRGFSEDHFYTSAISSGSHGLESLTFQSSSSTKHNPPFPLLEHLTLNRVKACPDPFKDLFQGLPKLRRLSFSHTPIHALEALLPSQLLHDSEVGTIVTVPCPDIDSLQVFGASNDAHHTVGFVMSERTRHGVSNTCNIALHFTSEIPPEALDIMVDMCGNAKFSVAEMYTDLDWEMDDESDDGDPYAPGGAFNDLEFDEFYTQSALLSH
ncbi:hypothetical protein SERLA73DRAFT_96603 [Serpula lacrymans var. lacrymans S7.3]|uniref:Uncharacterized protein n=2 Tax=Serpula lacrymans var. lacrymans TaxID=341189 RepID=F8QB70_SERL3|nr:uncharacterized protein SERLADRAFT_442754 [Serpula lacrymans var. lacrymans S7.9]EGN94456.1 hypothetical protein SERLA73DRAFT_96603 [Serpula lacrymans var. lacrymans S7.3]EGO19940.1 hypothetical protein SERLADRAFT_442754 [Serpula lacrymans var. lacrymans S7.9]